ncbi:hypothetical protein SPOG_02835 [Schizosaccharomyces cryophilus OY26]|uniref:Uncharacterized protein n=1 Tax=Schizosaccharomyces cryophilus (strain OY26 / ATCC MYA-4695 / CBS 11777 / NBRC 106824 / NRRL Y48691) TaxID=653667 RepID=S9W1P9_SCHCR|nr:uncharacterized protein SPOG_02835 [Schizosaccharomyces cryophilus OY26]EPY53943.1 hypothetical protein SPOG_02835 [Schizosaccharomyces cryophilus OY26]
MSQSEQTFEETVPLSFGIPHNHEEKYSKRLWERLENKYATLANLIVVSLGIFSFLFYIVYLVYFCFLFFSEPMDDTTAYYGIIASCSVLGLICLIFFSIYFQPIVIDIDENSIPMEDLSRNNGPKKN